MKKNIISLFLFLFIILLSGCSHIKGRIKTPDYPKKTKYEDTKGSQYQGLSLEYEFLNSIYDFSYKTTSKILNGDENQMYSPVSLFMALSMLAEGCNGKSLDEVLSILNVKNKSILQEENEKLFKKLYFENNKGKLLLANSIWLNKDREYIEDTLDVIAKKYYAHSYALDFSKPKNGKEIGKWVSKNTGGKLGNEDNEFQLEPDMLVILINTIYFYDEWVNQFEENLTTNKPFYSQKTNSVPFMINNIDSYYFENNMYAATYMPFLNDNKMYYILPEKNIEIKDIIKDESTIRNAITEVNKKAKTSKISIEVPKFKFESEFDLIPTLEQLGVKAIFDPTNADLSNLLVDDGFVTEIIQKSYVGVDEKGCIAAAYTKIVAKESASPECEFNLILNRPFIFVITSSDSIPLFIGIVNNPK